MADAKKKWWYLAEPAKDSVVKYVICAETLMNAIESMGVLKTEYDFSMLTWGQLSDLTGCLIPVTALKDLLASGDLMFRMGGKGVVIRSA